RPRTSDRPVCSHEPAGCWLLPPLWPAARYVAFFPANRCWGQTNQWPFGVKELGSHECSRRAAHGWSTNRARYWPGGDAMKIETTKKAPISLHTLGQLALNPLNQARLNEA